MWSRGFYPYTRINGNKAALALTKVAAVAGLTAFAFAYGVKVFETDREMNRISNYYKKLNANKEVGQTKVTRAVVTEESVSLKAKQADMDDDNIEAVVLAEVEQLF